MNDHRHFPSALWLHALAAVRGGGLVAVTDAELITHLRQRIAELEARLLEQDVELRLWRAQVEGKLLVDVP